MAKTALTPKQIRDYENMCRLRSSGELITPDGLRRICEELRYSPENIGVYFLGLLAQFASSGKITEEEGPFVPDNMPLEGQLCFEDVVADD